MTDEQTVERRRRGFWLREARDRKGLKQPDVAQRLGYSANSGSTVNKWETGERDVPTRYLALLAKLYGLPVSVFVYPEPTAEERLNELARGAIGLALEDVAGEEAEALSDDALPAAQLRRQRQ
jgi:transcriptional regulator with XRE-family HTH domain